MQIIPALKIQILKIPSWHDLHDFNAVDLFDRKSYVIKVQNPSKIPNKWKPDIPECKTADIIISFLLFRFGHQ